MITSLGVPGTRLSVQPGEAPATAPDGLLVDSYGRRHRDLRISLTDKCNLRCTYCMPEEGMEWLARSQQLTVDELVRIAAVAVDHGVTEIRLTGGEPLLHRDVVEITSRLASLPGAPEISMTTNGLRLNALAQPLRDAGLTRLNVSLDTLVPERYKELTRRDRFDAVLAGFDAADRAGFTGTKINTVLMRSINDDEAASLLRFALDRGYEQRFIEQMPLDAGHTWTRENMITADEIYAQLAGEFDLAPVPARGAAPAERWYVNGTERTVGIIASVTRPFCGACDRIRLTSDGQLRNCLFARTESDVRALIRGGGSDADIAHALGVSIAAKLPGHGINDPGFIQPERGMSAIGG
ncbi:GTP 3',8-cyclase MoaA [Timonella senegalensis]|uniref:GTP 3',8-cyclase MoaA n=1 Tax=Timonella senegalensis TaxID=1465825 RepID=UPI0028A626E6|nr:GTP 3',8-cyclase MoaA [Timonella senegalensis]